MSNEFVVVATFKAKEGKAMELRQALSNLIEPTRLEEGCLSYTLNESLDDPNIFTMIEKFKNKEAFDVHAKSAYLLNFKDNFLIQLVEMPSSIRFYQEL